MSTSVTCAHKVKSVLHASLFSILRQPEAMRPARFMNAALQQVAMLTVLEHPTETGPSGSARTTSTTTGFRHLRRDKDKVDSAIDILESDEPLGDVVAACKEVEKNLRNSFNCITRQCKLGQGGSWGT